jgi:hypothetical protein
MDAARHLWSRIVSVVGSKQKEPNFESWANSIRLIRERDEHSIEEIRSLIDVAHDNSFWRTNILSPDKLRAQWLRLSLLKGQQQPAKPPTAAGIPDVEETRRRLASPERDAMAPPRNRRLPA